MKYAIISILLLFSLSNSYAKKFDFNEIHGIKLGMKLDKALSILKNDSIEVEISNNNDAGKIYSFVSKNNILGVLTGEIRFMTNKGKISGFGIYYVVGLSDFNDALDGICNCREYNESSGSMFYYFDNCTFTVNEERESVLILNIVEKCKG